MTAQQGDRVHRPLCLSITRSFWLQLHSCLGSPARPRAVTGPAAVLSPGRPPKDELGQRCGVHQSGWLSTLRLFTFLHRVLSGSRDRHAWRLQTLFTKHISHFQFLPVSPCQP